MMTTGITTQKALFPILRNREGQLRRFPTDVCFVCTSAFMRMISQPYAWKNYTDRRSDAQTTSRFTNIETLELGESVLKEEFFSADRPVSMLADNDVGDSLAF